MRSLPTGWLALLFAVMLPLHTIARQAEKRPQERKIALWGHVFDDFTRHGLTAKITLMKADSTVVDTTTALPYDDAPYRFDVPAHNERYIIRAVMEGYDTCYVDFHVRNIGRNDFFDAPWHYMKRTRRNALAGTHDIGEVVVTGTKIRMVQRGDTIIYDAAAFNVPEGSMLDALVRQLPGAELKDNGDIYINGRRIDYLTLNGTDFFKGKNRVMLDNLPYYTVKNIKVYNKSTERSRAIGEDVERKDFVMDVNLKREYSRGLMGNVEGGSGTDSRYMGRLFGLAFTDKSRLSAYGNLNNINETRSPGGNGEWNPANNTNGLTTTKEAGFEFSREGGGKMSERAGGSIAWTDADKESRTLTQNNVAGSDVTAFAHESNRQKVFTANLWNNFFYRRLVGHPFSIHMNTSLRAGREKMYTLGIDSTLQDMLANRSWDGTYSHTHTLHFSHIMVIDMKLPWGDHLTIGGRMEMNRSKPNDGFSRQFVEYAHSDSSDYRNYYADCHAFSYDYAGGLQYRMKFLSGWALVGGFNYEQKWNDGHNANFRLDRLAAAPRPTGDDIGRQMFSAWLPDTPMQLAEALDRANSNSHSNLRRTYSPGLELMYQKERGSDFDLFSVFLQCTQNQERMRYTGLNVDTLARRHYFNFLPRVSLYLNRKRYSVDASFETTVTNPDFTALMPFDNATNALARTVNNPKLRKTTNHNFSLNLSANDSIGNRWNLNMDGGATHNAWGTRTTYHPATGAYTYMQDNVDGQWNEAVTISRTQFLDKARRLTLDASLGQRFFHHVDFAIATDERADGLSKVDNHNLGGALKLAFQYASLTAAVDGKVDWTHAKGNTAGFATISAWDYRYGVTLNCTLPWKVTLATDIRMYSRRGYSVSEMNTNDLVWNMLLSRGFCKGRLTVKAQAFDMLHRLSNTTYGVTAQGHTERWRKSIPRYVLLSLAWKFNHNPKRVRQNTGMY